MYGLWCGEFVFRYWVTTIGLGGILVGTQASQAHVGSVLRKLAFSQESQCPRCKQPLRLYEK